MVGQCANGLLIALNIQTSFLSPSGFRVPETQYPVRHFRRLSYGFAGLSIALRALASAGMGVEGVY